MNSYDKNTTIYLYAGPGAAVESLRQTVGALEELASFYKIQKIGPRELKRGDWRRDAALLIMPGGADIPYARHLSGEGTRKIKEFVEQGGAYLGICAGAYFGSACVAFEVGTPFEVHGTRELQFFQGTAEGPVLAPYDYHSNSGACVAVLRVKGSDAPVFSHFNGGCHFVNAEKIFGVAVLATYADSNKAAIVEMSVGKGRAILSGVHPEFSPYLINREDPYLNPIAGKLETHNRERIELMKSMLGKLGIYKVGL